MTQTKPKRDTIKSLAAEIKRLWPKLEVTVERGHTNTDRQIGRLVHPGKGRTGTRVIVRDPRLPRQGRMSATVILDHDNSGTYRTCAEVRGWIEDRKRDGRVEDTDLDDFS